MIRSYRVVASCFEPDLSQQMDARRAVFREHMEALLEEQKPDIVIVPEVALAPDIDVQSDCCAEPIDGPTITLVRELAGRYGSNICMPIVEKVDGRKFNTAVFVDRQGEIAGRYIKHNSTKPEMELGIIPGPAGQDPVVLDGLRIGSAICYDENYPGYIWNWIAKRVDLLVFPSYTFGGKLMQSWAVMCGVPLVVAFPFEAVVYDRDGSVLAEGGTWTTTVRFGNHPAWVGTSLNMQSRIYHLDYNQPKIHEIKRRYGSRINIRLMVREARFQITLVADDLSIERIEEEMQLTPLHTYLVDAWSIAENLRTKERISDEYDKVQ